MNTWLQCMVRQMELGNFILFTDSFLSKSECCLLMLECHVEYYFDPSSLYALSKWRAEGISQFQQEILAFWAIDYAYQKTVPSEWASAVPICELLKNS